MLSFNYQPSTADRGVFSTPLVALLYAFSRWAPPTSTSIGTSGYRFRHPGSWSRRMSAEVLAAARTTPAVVACGRPSRSAPPPTPISGRGRYALMRGSSAALPIPATNRFRFFTKAHLLRRESAADHRSAHHGSTSASPCALAVGDPELHKASNRARGLVAAGRLGLGVRHPRRRPWLSNVMVAPVLPRLTDSVEHLDTLLVQLAEDGATG